MAASCGRDPLVCIEIVVLGIGEFLKDWTTMAMLVILLGLLLRYRAARTSAREADYAKHLAAYAEKRASNEGQTTINE